MISLLAACGDSDSQELQSMAVSPAQPPAPAAVDEGYPWWRSVVFYEIFVRSFADSRTGPRAADGIGDLQGLIERLDYLNDGDPDTDTDLEIGALWLMPVMRSPSYHGYDVTDYRSIEKDYGSNADFKRLMDEAHRRGIRVIIDLVLNHTSSRHPWFRDAWRRRSVYHDWYIWSAEPHDYLGPWGQPVWHEAVWWQRGWRHFNHLSYYGIFWSGMPDLDYRNPDVTRAMYDVSRFWLKEMAADGFRLDAIRHLIEDGAVQEDTPETHAWLRDYQSYLEEHFPAALTVGEVWAETAAVATYGPDELDLTFQFALAREMLQAVKMGDATALREEAAEVWRAFPDGGAATFLSNHDQVRVMSVLDGHVERAKLAATLLLTGPGVPFLYYGEEIGTKGMKPDPSLRRPMQWSPDEHAGFSTTEPWQDPHIDAGDIHVAGQTDAADSLLSHYRRLIRLRNRHGALRVGDIEMIDSGNPGVYALQRCGDEECLLLVANLSEDRIDEYSLAMAPKGSTGEEPLVDLVSGRQVEPLVAPGYRPVAELGPLTGYLLRFPGGDDS
jgi:glycosidase